MKNLVPMVALIALAANSFVGMAAEPITGAFGFKLGSVPNVDTVQDVRKSDGKVIYYVNPEKPDAAYQRYSISVTPETKKIFSIRGSADFESKAAGLVIMKTAFKKLESIYGPGHPKEDWGVIESGDQFIMVQVDETPNKKGVLLVTYHDKKLEKLGELEAKPDQIDGAFGFKFGEVYDKDKALGTVKTTAGDPLYQANPPTKNSSFDVYYVAITPKSDRVYHVWAQGKVGSMDEGVLLQENLVKMLEGKYKLRRGLMDSEDARILMQDDKLITIKAARYPDGSYRVDLKYYDSKLEKKAKEEADSGKKVPADTKGL
jgi:hypothetical protein